MIEGEKKYYSLRETETETGVPASTLRYWEKQFDELSPRKDGHGNRYYTREDQEVIKRIKYIRDEMKITRIEAIRKELKGNTRHSDERQSAMEILLRVKEELCEIRKMIK
jgi:DNA-binding transcriptional MerR regulator